MPKLPFAILVVFSVSLSAHAQWPQFRGPAGDGHANVERAPTKWADDSENVVWSTPIDGLGWSSPVVARGKVWLTTATEEGRSLRAVCLALDGGKVLHDIEVFRRDEPLKIHTKNSHASPTPIIAGERVFVHFGTYGTACLSTDGEVLWRQELTYRHVHGPGGSPVLHEDLLIVNCDGGDKQFVVALEQETGKIRWQTDRPENPANRKFAFCTPTITTVDGESQLISPGAGGVSAYDPKTGKQLWRVDYPGGYSVVPRPVVGHGMVFVSSGYDRPVLHAIRLGGEGNVTESHVAWKLDRGAPHNPSPLLVGDELYLISDRGIATCVGAANGEIHWQERIGGNFSASPLLAAGRIYLLDEKGFCTVIAPGKEFEELAKNTIEGRTLASLAFVKQGMLLRTDSKLMLIE